MQNVCCSKFFIVRKELILFVGNISLICLRLRSSEMEHKLWTVFLVCVCVCVEQSYNSFSSAIQNQNVKRFTHCDACALRSHATQKGDIECLIWFWNRLQTMSDIRFPIHFVVRLSEENCQKLIESIECQPKHHHHNESILKFYYMFAFKSISNHRCKYEFK